MPGNREHHWGFVCNQAEQIFSPECLKGALMSGFFSLQINLDSTMKVISRRSISVAYGEPVHPIMQFDPSDSTYLYLMTSYQVSSSAFCTGLQSAPCI